VSPYLELSGRDETLASSFYTGVATRSTTEVVVARFGYTIRRQERLLDRLAASLGPQFSQPLPPEHMELVHRQEEQSAEDLALAERMLAVQREAAGLSLSSPCQISRPSST